MMFRNDDRIQVGWAKSGRKRRPRQIDAISPLSDTQRARVGELTLELDRLRVDLRDEARQPRGHGLAITRSLFRAKGELRALKEGARDRADNPMPRQRLRNFRGSDAKLDALVISAIRDLLPKRGTMRSFSAEEIAIPRGIQVHQVKQSLHRLNLRGIVSQARRCHAHDSNRAPLFYGLDSGWGANVYDALDAFPA